MASQISAVLHNTLTVDPDGSGATIPVGEPAWFDWLTSATTFRYSGTEGHFTARKERASHGRGGWYWKAYRRTDGKLHRAYLGPAAHLTTDRLAEAAAALARPGRPAGHRRSAIRLGADEPDVHRPNTAGESPIRRPARLRLLGAFDLTDGDGNVVAIGSPRAQSLLAYLVLHRDVPQSRRQISFLLWPDSTEAQARNNLRQLLHQLRQSWPGADDFLSTAVTLVELRPGRGLEVDTDEYERAVGAAFAADQGSDPAELRVAFERAARHYRGDLLPGSYDEWIAPERERLMASHERMLDRLIGLLEQQGDYRAAIDHCQQRLRLDPLDERVCRSLMRLHALNQDRAGAIRVYHACAALLERELGVEPDPETRLAYEQIVGLEVGASTALARSSGADPAAALDGPAADTLPLVGRQPEWAQVMTAWRRMTEGEAHLLLIAGEAGVGKSRLAAELSDWAGQRGVRSARTRAYAAEGRLSYAPVADWLRSPVLAFALRRLDVTSLSEISRLLPELIAERPDVPRPSARIEDWQRQPFFQALARAFLIADRPLLLILDDLQWCDADTLEWLHFLLRFDPRANLLVAGTVRPDEVDRRHPLTGVMAELRDTAQLTEIELGPLDPSETSTLAGQIAGRRLGAAQARHIHVETEGNPLFVVEMVRAGLGDADTGGEATSPMAEEREPGTAPEARRLPPKVQAVIAARLAQLSESARGLAAVAATVGRAFTLEVVREGSGVEDLVLVQALDELVRRQIVREQGSSVYDFAHDKIREVAYGGMTETRRRLLHRRVAEALERVHAPVLDAVAAQVAAHYASADLADRAAVYYQRAAEVAQRVGANQEAIDLLLRGLTLLETLPPSLDRDARELDLRTALGVSLVATKGYGASEVSSVYSRCRQLCQILGRPPSPPILRALALASLAKVKIEECHALGDHMLSLADRDDDPVLRAEAHYVIAMALLLSGAAVPARAQLEASLAHYDRARSAAHIGLYSQDPGVACRIRLSLDLWMLGEPAEAARRRAESLALAEELGHPFTLAYALTWDAVLQSHRGDRELARTQAEGAMRLGREHKMPFWLGFGTIVHGWAVAEQGDIEGGIEEIRSGMAHFAATGTRSFVPFQLGLLAEQHGRLGNVERGLTLIAEALALVERTNERWPEVELLRRRGELFEKEARDDDAETAYRRAVDVARYQDARALELRSATRLAGIWLRQGRVADVAPLLRPVVRYFGTTTDLPDLDLARGLLDRAGSSRNRRADLTVR
jgi:DNA-binding SARP family transcriptional activator/predicted ATPase